MSKWFKTYQKSKHPKLRIFCFPYACGSAQIFSNWSDQFPQSVDVLAVQSPGRGRRFTEKPMACLKTKVASLYKEIIPFTHIPFVFIGHSNGALLAFELGRELQKSGCSNLKHIVLSAKRAPHLPAINKPIHDLPKEQFLSELKRYNFTPDEVLENEELMEILLPMMRADFSLSDNYHFEKGCSLESNASLFWGNKDQGVPKNDIMAWSELIRGEIDTVEFDGGHFFITQSEDLFLKEINKIIEHIL